MQDQRKTSCRMELDALCLALQNATREKGETVSGKDPSDSTKERRTLSAKIINP